MRGITGPSSEIPAAPFYTSQPCIYNSALTAHGCMVSGAARASRLWKSRGGGDFIYAAIDKS